MVAAARALAIAVLAVAPLAVATLGRPAAAQRVDRPRAKRATLTTRDRRVTRLPDGSPARGYWQQQVDYTLDATLDPAARVLTGRGTITYHNNSPDVLGELHWHLYQNIFRADSGKRRSAIVGRSMTVTRGITVTRVATRRSTLVPEVTGTLMRTRLPTPLAPGDSAVLEVEWTLDVPAIASLRTGSDGEDFGMAQWYPQISTYDDVHGWHDLPYRGQGEFYLEYGDWDVRLTLPRRFLVAATGTLRNADALLAPAQAAALRGVGDAPVGQLTTVVGAADTGGRGAPGGATRTWHFTAERVRDFAWAASPRFVWNATRTRPLGTQPRGVLIHSFYTVDRTSYYAHSWAVARAAIEFFSAGFGDYVYPQATVVSGPVEGMEYPMLVFEGVESDYLNMPELVTVHELGHQWFPMMVGSNETRHAFMDEGFTTFLEMDWFRAHHGRGGAWSPQAPASVRGLLGAGDVRRLYDVLALTGPSTVPLATPADDIPPVEYGAVAYQKPGAVLAMLRDVVGDSVMNAAMRTYYARWLYKHPYPDDFFRTVESVAGRDLGWFWQPWFYGTGRFDLALTGVRSVREGTGWRADLSLANPGGIPMPVTVQLTLENGAVRRIRLPETIWQRPDSAGGPHVATQGGLPAPVRTAELDPDRVLLDQHRDNDVWPDGAPTAAGPLFGVTLPGLLGILLLATVAAVLVRGVGLLDGIRISGFRPARYALGPLSLWTATRGFGWRRVRGPRLYGAGVLAVPPPGSDIARGTASLAAAGPVASLLGAVVLLAIAFLLDRRYHGGLRPDANLLVDSTLVLTAGAALLGFVRALAPRHARGAYIPSSPWIRLLAKPRTDEMRRWSAMRAVVAQSFAGVRPRGWNAEWVRAATEPTDGSAAEAGACMLAYLCALDRGDAPEAGALLERAHAAAGRRWWRFRIRRHVNAERAFHAAYVEGDAAEGRRLLERTGARRGPLPSRRRARAAVYLAAGDLARAEREARSGLESDAATEEWAGAGIARFERYWLTVLAAAAVRGGAGGLDAAPFAASDSQPH